MNNFNQNSQQNPAQQMAKGQTPTIEIESDLILYVFGGMLIYNIYNKYVSNNIFKSDDPLPIDGNIISNTSLNFNK
jgi:hypothetical protein